MKKLFGFVMVGSNDLNKSAKFYDAVFVHSSAAQEASLELNEGDELTFDVESGDKGPSAVNLQKASGESVRVFLNRNTYRDSFFIYSTSGFGVLG